MPTGNGNHLAGNTMADYEFSIPEDHRYILCRINGPMTVDDARDFSVEINQMSGDSGIKKLLFDVQNAPFVSDVARQYVYVSSEIPKLNLYKDVRIAVLIDPTDRSHDFMESMLQKVGINMRVFEDMNRAMRWLHGAGDFRPEKTPDRD